MLPPGAFDFLLIEQVRYHMEIERKFTIKQLPANLSSYPFHHIEQGYLNTTPVVRVRREDEEYYLTYKGSGMLAREEHTLAHPTFRPGFPTPPADYSLTIELDVFDPPFAPLILAEVEFGSKEAAEAFVPPEWFLEDVTYRKEYHNSYMAMQIWQ